MWPAGNNNERNRMKLKFTKAVPAGRDIYLAGETYEVKNQHAAETYMAHGYAVPVQGDGEAAAAPAQVRNGSKKVESKG